MAAAAPPPTQPDCFLTVKAAIGSVLGCLGSYCCCCASPYVTVFEGSSLIVRRFGNFYSDLPPGNHYLRPLTDVGVVVSKRITVLDLSNQEVLTQDNLTIQVKGSVFYRVTDASVVVFQVANVKSLLNQLVHAALRGCIAHHTLQDCLEHRDILATQIREYVVEHSQDWGIEIINVLIEDIRLSAEMQRMMSASATAKRQADARIIDAQADVAAARLMRDASDLLNTPAALQIRQLQTLEAMASIPGPKLMFVPMDSMGTSSSPAVTSSSSSSSSSSSFAEGGESFKMIGKDVF